MGLLGPQCWDSQLSLAASPFTYACSVWRRRRRDRESPDASAPRALRYYGRLYGRLHRRLHGRLGNDRRLVGSRDSDQRRRRAARER